MPPQTGKEAEKREAEARGAFTLPEQSAGGSICCWLRFLPALPDAGQLLLRSPGQTSHSSGPLTSPANPNHLLGHDRQPRSPPEPQPGLPSPRRLPSAGAEAAAGTAGLGAPQPSNLRLGAIGKEKRSGRGRCQREGGGGGSVGWPVVFCSPLPALPADRGTPAQRDAQQQQSRAKTSEYGGGCPGQPLPREREDTL